MIFWEMFRYHQSTLKILSLQYVVMFAVLIDCKRLQKVGHRLQNLLIDYISL